MNQQVERGEPGFSIPLRYVQKNVHVYKKRENIYRIRKTRSPVQPLGVYSFVTITTRSDPFGADSLGKTEKGEKLTSQSMK